MIRQVAELKAQDLDRSEKVVAELRELSSKAENKMMEVEAARNAEEVCIHVLLECTVFWHHKVLTCLYLGVHGFEPNALRMTPSHISTWSAHDFEPSTLRNPHVFRSNSFVPLPVLENDGRFRIGKWGLFSRPCLPSSVPSGAWIGGEVCTELPYSTSRGGAH